MGKFFEEIKKKIRVQMKEVPKVKKENDALQKWVCHGRIRLWVGGGRGVGGWGQVLVGWAGQSCPCGRRDGGLGV